LHEYNANFYSLLASFAVRSAAEVVPLLRASLPVHSVVDFGCGQGAWLSIWRRAGANVAGVDGPYVDRQRLMIETTEFYAADLGRPIDLGRRFDLVQSLEVAEHLPRRQAADFVGTLTAHGPVVMFSAAVPGQGGEHHLNEQPLEYWREMFRRRGFVAIDCIRPQVVDNQRIERWYRCNILLYVQQHHLEGLPDRLRSFRVPENQRLRNYWPLPHQIRHALVRQLPRASVDFLARRKAQRTARRAWPTA
jgi:SAM-dependent methyltransferase